MQCKVERVLIRVYRKSPPLRKVLPSLIAFLWLSMFMFFWEPARYVNVPALASRTRFQKMVDQWHLDDSRLPLLSPLRNPGWTQYPPERLKRWSEPPKEKPTNPNGPGEEGRPVLLTSAQKKEAKRTSSLHQINLVASDLVSLNRTLKDYRNPSCSKVTYPLVLPTATVIIIFHNEARSTLLRTVHSVINRSPRELIDEIILVDDASDLKGDSLGHSLEHHVAQLAVKVTIIRSKKREGLIRARLIGAEAASSDSSILIFFDAHVEVAPGWLPPILKEISDDRTRIVLPVIDDIDYQSFEYIYLEEERERGGLDWKLLHAWIGQEPLEEGDTPADAFPSPTMIGCAFALDKEFFYAAGSYDSSMEIWGGENVELSVRAWRCGGSVMVAPCSRVGHVYRLVSPHSIPGGLDAKLNTITINSARFAKVWLDEEHFKFFEYMNPTVRDLTLGDLSERFKLKERLECHSFKWFLNHVYTDSGFPQEGRTVYLGQIEDLGSGLCLDGISKSGDPGLRLCHGFGGYQTILYTSRGELRSSTRCLTPDQKNGTLLNFEKCDQSLQEQIWTFDLMDKENESGRFQHILSGLCLGVPGQKNTEKENKKRGSSVLNYLALVAQDITNEIKRPVLLPCQDNIKWAMNLPSDWK